MHIYVCVYIHAIYTYTYMHIWIPKFCVGPVDAQAVDWARRGPAGGVGQLLKEWTVVGLMRYGSFRIWRGT